MSDQKNNMYHGQLVKLNGKLEHVKSADAAKYKAFVASLAEGQIVDHFMDANVDDGTLPQLAKVHKCIRELAKETGHSFIELKYEVKKRAGLYVEKTVGSEVYRIFKSFGKCSKDELGAAIQTIIEMGDAVNINFR